ncbi:DUF4249 domain-containing protein [Flaviaesturariibacter amylovorans]|uniref:DUF4249 domain-containing protein n=1 Tax=Flaviaesturariibacter amylovorans TaxID=1084520 RepID=A0ABP8GWC3_9BACT
MRHRAFMLLPFAAFALAGCERDIDIELDNVEPKLVVEATIENGEAPVVILTRSLNYFSTLSLDQVLNNFVHGAAIDISTGTRTHRLKEYTFAVGPYNLSYYSTDSSNLATAITGTLNTSYNLRIETEGRIYTATTTIPNITKRIDSMWWRPNPRDSSEGKVQLMIRTTDPRGYGDYGRYWTRKNEEEFRPGRNSVFDDLVVDGTTYEIPVSPGVERGDQRVGWEERVFRRGDTITLKLANIDKATFDFWRTMEYTYSTVGNPFSSPIKVLSNVKPDALGYFGGYASQYRTLIVPE